MTGGYDDFAADAVNKIIIFHIYFIAKAILLS